MNKIHGYKKIWILLLAAVLCFSTVGCQPNAPEEGMTGIRIDEDTPYSAEALAYAEQAILSLVTDAYRKAVADKISEKVEARLLRYAQRITQITAAEPVSEAQYRAAIDMLAQRGIDALDELLALRVGESVGLDRTRMLYLDLAGAFGADRIAAMLYDGCLFVYEARYERAIERHEDYGYPWYLEEAEALAAEKAIFASSIGRTDFSALVRCATALAELLAVDTDEIAGAFSNAEVLEVVRHLNLEEIKISKEGWVLLLSHAMRREDDTYAAKLCDAFVKSGDVERLAAVMNDALSLLVSVMDRLTPEDIGNLRAQAHDTLLHAIFARFTEADWQSFERITSVSPSNEQYSELASAEYGEAYAQYLSSLHSVTLAELRASIGDDGFYQCLLDYLAGICPAVSYEVGL